MSVDLFPCTNCGQCCRLVNMSSATAFLDRGDGVCQYLDTVTNLCTIYHQRPIICNISVFYNKHLSQTLSWEEYVNMNLEMCRKFQEDARKKPVFKSLEAIKVVTQTC